MFIHSLPKTIRHGGFGLLAAALLSACESIPELDEVVKDRSVEYKSSRSLPPLEVPPDLTSSSIDDSMVVPDVAPADGTATYSEYATSQRGSRTRESNEVLINPQGIDLERDGDKRWLVLEGEPEKYWERVRGFWLDNGLLIKIEDRAVGIMETDWAENRADIPQGWLRSTLGGLLDQLYSTATRDKYRIRFERGLKQGTTELYLSHRGAEEIAQGDTTIWQPRPSDPELEAEMLNRLMVFLGIKEDRAKRMLASTSSHRARAHIADNPDGPMSLILEDDFSRAWRRTGLALDRVGFTVEDRDRSRGLYYVRYVDPLKDEADEEQGLLSKLMFWNGDDDQPKAIEYLIQLVGEERDTRVNVLDKEGAAETSSTADRILNLLYEQLK